MSTFIAQVFYKDTMAIYRQDDRDKDARNNSKGMRLVSGGPWACNKHDTDNYDTVGSPAGQSKENNIMTSDKVTMGLEVPLRTEDIIHFIERDEWFTVAGAVKTRMLLQYQKAYLTITPKPKILAGAWNG